VRPGDESLALRLDAGLRRFARQRHPLLGIQAPPNRRAFLEQVVESIRRITYISVIGTRNVSDIRADPSSDLFDPLKAAVLRKRQGQIDEAFWLVFLSVHFGKNRHTGWRLARDIYGRLGGAVTWNWARTSADPKGLRRWLTAHQGTFSTDGVPRHFGNHRKYESLGSTGAVVESYVRWVRPGRTHEMLVQEALRQAGRDPRRTFDYLYRSMSAVARFGRTARFDYLTMVGKLRLAPIEPGSTYMQGATGPLNGARLLFGGTITAALSPSDLDAWLVRLEAELDLGIHGMQVLEDSLCNWQKRPDSFQPFRG